MDAAKDILVDFWMTASEMSPYLLFGFLVAGLMSVFVSQELVRRHLGKGGVAPLLKATVLGIPLPLCSCGVIPVSISLRKHGASKGATIAFLLSTPQTGVDSIFVTFSLLGPVFAVVRPLAALVTGLVGGSLTEFLDRGSGEFGSEPEACTEGCCTSQRLSARLLHGLRYGFVTLPRDIGKAMLIGLLIAASISALIPDNFFDEWLGEGIGAMIVMMVLGIPVYVCATASVPVAAALMLKGLTPGAALVFLMTGPATNAAGLATIYKALGRRTAVAYLLTVAGCSLAGGLILDSILTSAGALEAADGMFMLPPVVRYAAAVVLFAVLTAALVRPEKH